jgi:hypothetical protein
MYYLIGKQKVGFSETRWMFPSGVQHSMASPLSSEMEQV